MEAKIIAGLVGLIAAVAFIGWVIVADYDAGKHAGENLIQTAWDKDKAAIQATADAAIAADTKDKEVAMANNDGVINDLNTQLAHQRTLNGNLADRLRDAEGRAAASGSALSKTTDQLRVASGATALSLGQINGAVADALNECGAVRADYKALIAELSPQL